MNVVEGRLGAAVLNVYGKHSRKCPVTTKKCPSVKMTGNKVVPRKQVLSSFLVDRKNFIFLSDDITRSNTPGLFRRE